jgi:hypothetical protein
MSMATKDTRPAVMADSGSPRPGSRSLAHPPPACHLPDYGPPAGHDRAQALLDLLAVALNGLDRASRRSRRFQIEYELHVDGVLPWLSGVVWHVLALSLLDPARNQPGQWAII